MLLLYPLVPPPLEGLFVPLLPESQDFLASGFSGRSGTKGIIMNAPFSLRIPFFEKCFEIPFLFNYDGVDRNCGFQHHPR